MSDVVAVGLGNPGARYASSFHNVGYKVLERLAAKQGWPWNKDSRHNALVAKGEVKGVVFHLIKPETFMNLSGEAVQSYLHWLKLPVEALTVIVDDADLPLGSIRERPYGGNGGHNGLKSIEQRIGTNRFDRIRIGIGRDDMIPLADYVLMAQGEEKWKEILPAIDQAVLLLEAKCNGEKNESRENKPL